MKSSMSGSNRGRSYGWVSGMRYTLTDSPLGEILLAGGGSGLSIVSFQSGAHPVSPSAEWKCDRAPFAHVVEQLDAYFAGVLRTFDLALAPRGTVFQTRVWEGLREIPYGETVSYGALAASIGRPTAARAVGAANRRNPLLIVVPCHRVIGRDGALTGFGSGLDIKEALLRLEGVL